MGFGRFHAIFWILLASLASAQAKEAPLQLTIPKPLLPPPAKCVVLQGLEFNSEPLAMRRTFLENFDTLDLSKEDGDWGWKTHLPFNRFDQWQGRTLPSAGEQQLYVDERFRPPDVGLVPRNPFTVVDGLLTITAMRQEKPIGPFKDTSDGLHTLPFTSGLLSSYGRFAQKYGYFEVRAKIPLARASWSTLWMMRSDKIQWPPEIDVIEVNNRAPEWRRSQGSSSVHSKEAGQHTADGCYRELETADTQFHDYGVLWTAEHLIFYTDRQPVVIARTPADLHVPLYLLLTLSIGPNMNRETPDKIDLQADWIAAYSFD